MKPQNLVQIYLSLKQVLKLAKILHFDLRTITTDMTMVAEATKKKLPTTTIFIT